MFNIHDIFSNYLSLSRSTEILKEPNFCLEKFTYIRALLGSCLYEKLFYQGNL